MPLKSAALEEPMLNLTPMIDVVFNLIIFFMVGTQFADMERQFDVQLPKVSTAQPQTSLPDEIVINVYASGKIVMGNDTLTLVQLGERLAAAHQNYSEQAVLVRGDGASAYQHIMNVLAVCHEAKITNFSLATQIREDASS